MNAPFAPPQAANALPMQQLPPQAAPLPPVATPPPAAKPVTHDVTIVTTKKRAQAKVMGVPPEEFGIERGARSIRDCNYCFHEIVTKTVSQLIAEGYDEDQVNNLEDYTGNTEIETLSRDTVGEHYNTVTAASNPASRLVKLTEHYIRLDYEGNGRASLYQVVTAGTQGDILRKDGKEQITPFDAIPFAATCPVPQPHRFFERSIADLVMPVQREKTALKRGALDNLYLHNNPRVEVSEANAGPNTLDDLLVSRPGGVVRTKTPGGLNWQTVPDITGSVWPAMQYLDAELASRTGLDKQSQGIDANALQNQSATAVAQVFSASQMRMKLIARIMAEGVRDIFALLHGTIQKHGSEKQTFRLRNKWIDVDPRDWKTRDHMTINVGLGTGGKAQQFAQTMAIANVQKELIQGGKQNLVGDMQLYNTAAELTRIMGHKNPDRFFNDPSAKDPRTGQLLHRPAPPPPNPKLLAMQAKAEADAQSAQSDAQMAQFKAQSDAARQQLKAQSDAQLAAFKAQLDQRMMVIEAALQEGADARAAALQQQQAQHAQEAHAQNMAKGVLDIVATTHAHDAKVGQIKPQPVKTDD
jgi:hypothetical protein